MTELEREALVDVREVRKSYRRGPEEVHALAGVTTSLAPAEVVALIGRSGSGKTTLLNVLCGWEKPDSGEVVWYGGRGTRPVADLPWSEIAIVPQGLGLVEELSVRENIELPLRLQRNGASRDELRRKGGTNQRVETLLGALGLQALADRGPAEISIGEQQRTAVARALVLLPRLLLADEPTGHQDETWAHGVLRLLRFAADRGVCCFLATHNREVVRYADRILGIKDGLVTSIPVRSSAAAVRT
jgi:putative ABC transport system ATP-binding protein